MSRRVDRTAALTIGAVLVAIALAWVVLVVPARQEAGSRAREIEQLHGELAAAQAPTEIPVDSIPGISPRLQVALRRAVPAQARSGEVIGTLARAARAAGVGLSSVGFGAPSAAAGQEAVTAIPVHLSVRGSYREIVAFVDRLDTLVTRKGDDVQAGGRLISIGGLEIGAGSAAGQTADSLRAQMQASAYTMPPERGPR